MINDTWTYIKTKWQELKGQPLWLRLLVLLIFVLLLPLLYKGIELIKNLFFGVLASVFIYKLLEPEVRQVEDEIKTMEEEYSLRNGRNP